MLASLLEVLIQIPAALASQLTPLGRHEKMALVLDPLLPRQETTVGFQSSGFSLVQPWLLRPLENKPEDQRSLLTSLSHCASQIKLLKINNNRKLGWQA